MSRLYVLAAAGAHAATGAGRWSHHGSAHRAKPDCRAAGADYHSAGRHFCSTYLHPRHNLVGGRT
eukprot:1139091-Pelagomonas_calceolata.AAC.6